jgi:adenylate kinase family enzyme
MNFRSDDQEKVLVNRLLEYDNLTKPILEYYNKFGVVEEINSNQDIAEVSSYTLKLYSGLISL